MRLAKKFRKFRIMPGLRWLLVGGLLFMMSGCASSDPSPDLDIQSSRIGVVDTQRLLERAKLGQQVTDSLNEFMTDRQVLIDLEQKELRNLESELLRQGSVLSASAKKQREEKFRRKMMEYQQKVSNLNREVQEKQAELFSEFRESVEEIVQKVAQQEGLTLVLEKGPNTNTRYFDPTLDVTDKVLQALDREFR